MRREPPSLQAINSPQPFQPERRWIWATRGWRGFLRGFRSMRRQLAWALYQMPMLRIAATQSPTSVELLVRNEMLVTGRPPKTNEQCYIVDVVDRSRQARGCGKAAQPC